MKKSRLTKTNSYEYATNDHLPRKSYMMSQLNQEQRLAQGIADYRKNIGYTPENRMDTFENYKIFLKHFLWISKKFISVFCQKMNFKTISKK